MAERNTHNHLSIVKLPAMYSKELRFIINSCLEIKEFDRIDIR